MNRQRILSELDLEPIIVKAIDAEEGHGWSLGFASRIADEYRKFLVLCVEHPGEPVVPSSFVDDFWHLHILDTQKYMEDCNRYLGYMLHHFPYFGMRGEEDARNLRRAWEKTLALYEAAFGKAAPSDLWPKSNRCPNCAIYYKRGHEELITGPVFDDWRPRLADMGLSL